MAKLTRRHGLTIVELLVVMAIIATLVAILLPAIQNARESARISACKNNLRQIGLAVLEYSETNNDRLPASWRTISDEYGKPAQIAKYHLYLSSFSWRTTILPFLDEQPLHDQLNYSSTPIANDNSTLVAVVLSVFQCPSTPDSPRTVLSSSSRNLGIGMGANDYHHVHRVGTAHVHNEDTVQEDPTAISSDGLAGSWYGLSRYEHLTSGNSHVHAIDRPGAKASPPLRWCTDGLSKTILVAEKAGWPNRYIERNLNGSWGDGIWASAEFGSFGKANVNWSNFPSIYAFHESGAHVAMCDGSVTLLGVDTSEDVVVSLCSRAGDESE